MGIFSGTSEQLLTEQIIIDNGYDNGIDFKKHIDCSGKHISQATFIIRKKWENCEMTGFMFYITYMTGASWIPQYTNSIIIDTVLDLTVVENKGRLLIDKISQDIRDEKYNWLNYVI